MGRTDGRATRPAQFALACRVLPTRPTSTRGGRERALGRTAGRATSAAQFAYACRVLPTHLTSLRRGRDRAVGRTDGRATRISQFAHTCRVLLAHLTSPRRDRDRALERSVGPRTTDAVTRGNQPILAGTQCAMVAALTASQAFSATRSVSSTAVVRAVGKAAPAWLQRCQFFNRLHIFKASAFLSNFTKRGRLCKLLES